MGKLCDHCDRDNDGSDTVRRTGVALNCPGNIYFLSVGSQLSCRSRTTLRPPSHERPIPGRKTLEDKKPRGKERSQGAPHLQTREGRSYVQRQPPSDGSPRRDPTPQARAILPSPLNPRKLLFEATKVLDGLILSRDNKDRDPDRSPSVFQHKVSVTVTVM